MDWKDTPLFRAADPETSRQGAKDVRVRQGTQIARLLHTYAMHPSGLTNEEAGFHSGLAAKPGCCYWHRCSDLLAAGLVEDTGLTREATTGSLQRVLRITDAGWDTYGKLRMDEARGN